MVRRLEEIGLVVRRRHYADKRAKLIVLTSEGLRRIRLAVRVIMTWGYFHLAYEGFFGFGREESFFEIDDLSWQLMALARDFGNASNLQYPTDHPDE
jgi:DNA-binding MarR family transcriptional regulator